MLALLAAIAGARRVGGPGRRRAARRLAVQSPRDGDVEFHRRGARAVRRHRAGRCIAAAPRRLRHRRHRHRPAPDHGDLPQVAGARHLGQRRLARVRECPRLSGGAVEPAARRHRQYRNAAPAAARPRILSIAAARQRPDRGFRARRSVPPLVHQATVRSRPLPRGVERGHVPDARIVPGVDPAAGRGAGRHLRGRRAAVRRRRA